MFKPRAPADRDYNRCTPAAAAGRDPRRNGGEAASPPRAVLSWPFSEGRAWWSVPLLLAPLLCAVLFPLDEWIAARAANVVIGGELRRELEVWQQYGAAASFFLAALIVWFMDPAQRVRLYDLAMAAGLVGLGIVTLKILVGRARPGFAAETGEAGLYVPAWATYPVFGDAHLPNWEAGARLWSMPSSHTAYAVLLSVFLISLYPRFKWIGIGLATFVGVCRVLFQAHYPSDVAVGACIAMAIAVPAVRGQWGILTRNTIWDYLVLPVWGFATGLAQRRSGRGAREAATEPPPREHDGSRASGSMEARSASETRRTPETRSAPVASR